jgi:hypothetical protein
MLGWVRAAWGRLSRPMQQVGRAIQKRVGSFWNILKAIAAVVLAGLVVSTSHVLALGLVVVPFVRRVSNDYAKVFVGFIVVTLGGVLLANGLIVFADAFIVVLSWAMYEMLNRWWSHVEAVEARTV